MRIRVFLPVAIASLVTSCATMPPASLHAAATIESRSGSSVAGRLTLTQSRDVVRAHLELHGLPPGSEHGFHIHDKGDCSAPDATSAGGHFNPAGVAHGSAGSAPHHAGDAPSVVADARGEVRVDLTLEGVTLAAGPLSIVGRSVIVHRDRDDYTTQPTGNSGPRLACGVIAAP